MLGEGNGGSETGGRASTIQGHAAAVSIPARPASSWGSNSGAASGFNLAEYWRLALKHRLLIGGILLAALVIGTAATLIMTPIYTATTTLQIDREVTRILNVDDTSPQEPVNQGEEFYQTQYGLLKSRSLAERVVESLGLASSDAFLTTMGFEAPDAASGGAARRRNLVIDLVQENLSVAPVRGSRLVNISFNSPDPALSARVANAFAENFIQANLDRKFESSKYARQFLEERINQTKARLEDAERQLVAYATQQQIINVSEASDENGGVQSLASSNLVQLNTALATARANRVEAQEKWRQAQASSLGSLAEVLDNPTVQRLSEERAKLDAQYQQNLRTYQPDYPDMLALKSQIDELDRQINTLSQDIRNSIRSAYVIAANQERSLLGQVNGLKGDVLDLRDRTIQYNILLREVDTTRTLYDGLLQRYKEVGVTGAVTANNISVVDAARAPVKPAKPNLLVNLAMAFVVGLGLGLLCAFVLEALDESLATPDDVESKLGVPVLGVVPLLDKGVSPIEALKDIRSAFSEAYYSLRTALQFSTPNGVPHTLLVTSSRPAEGKSTTAFAIAQNFARVGKRVLLVDGDLRNPSMHRIVGVENERGMSNVLSGSSTISDVARPTSVENLAFIPCGPLPPNPAELWGSDRVHRFMEEAQAAFDYVVIDGPPVLGFADAPLLASAVGGTLFVLESRGTRRGQARGALQRLEMGKSKLLGAVLTKFNTRTTSYGGYDYAYDYEYGAGSTSGKKRAR